MESPALKPCSKSMLLCARLLAALLFQAQFLQLQITSFGMKGANFNIFGIYATSGHLAVLVAARGAAEMARLLPPSRLYLCMSVCRGGTCREHSGQYQLSCRPCEMRTGYLLFSLAVSTLAVFHKQKLEQTLPRLLQAKRELSAQGQSPSLASAGSVSSSSCA